MADGGRAEMDGTLANEEGEEMPEVSFPNG